MSLYLDRTRGFRGPALQLLVCYGGPGTGQAISSEGLSTWLQRAVSASLGSGEQDGVLRTLLGVWQPLSRCSVVSLCLACVGLPDGALPVLLPGSVSRLWPLDPFSRCAEPCAWRIALSAGALLRTDLASLCCCALGWEWIWSLHAFMMLCLSLCDSWINSLFWHSIVLSPSLGPGPWALCPVLGWLRAL